MQTNFTLAALADPQMRESEKILRTCVHCGFCTATCPTYLLLGDELDSPRGRIYLIKDMLEGGKQATGEVVKSESETISGGKRADDRADAADDRNDPRDRDDDGDDDRDGSDDRDSDDRDDGDDRDDSANDRDDDSDDGSDDDNDGRDGDDNDDNDSDDDSDDDGDDD